MIRARQNYSLRRFWLQLGVLFWVSHLAVAHANTPFPPNQSKTLGTSLPEVHFVDDTGTAFLLSSLKGKPLLLSPIFATCKFTCSPITQNLSKALPPEWKLGTQYNVLTFSFDPADTPEKMRSIRQRHQLPAEWKVAVGNYDEIRKLLDAMDFRYMTLEEDGYAHSNFVIAADSDQRIQFYLLGVNHETANIRRALEAASHLGKWKDTALVVLALVSLFGLAGCAWFVVHTLTRRRQSPSIPA